MMETVKLGKGKYFLKKGSRLKGLYVILKGSVRAVSKNDEMDMDAGSIIGIFGSDTGRYECDYITNTDCVFYVFPYSTTEDYKKIFAYDEKYVAVFTMGAMHQTSLMLKRYNHFYKKAQDYYKFLTECYEEYRKFCGDYGIQERPFDNLTSMAPVYLEEKIHTWTIEYYTRMSEISLKAMDKLLGRDYAIGIGEIMNAVGWMQQSMSLISEIKDYLKVHRNLLLSSESGCLFRMYFDLAKKASAGGVDMEALFKRISGIMEYVRNCHLFDEKLINETFDQYEHYDFYQTGLEDTDIIDGEKEEYEENTDYLNEILLYAGYKGEKADSFKKSIQEYKNLPDMYATTDETRKLRRKLTQDFYDIYAMAFFQAMDGVRMPVAVKMFLNFGFMDAGIAGEENAHSLHDMAQELYRCKADNVYTMYEWLKSIYLGKNEPSRNEFDMDYTGYLNEQKKTGRITADEVKILANDNRKKVEFEMQNMFASNNRATYGKISTFCAVWHEDDVVGTIEKMLVTAERANAALDEIRKIDFSLFYREVGFSDVAREVNLEMIQKEVIPYIILMPNPGSRAMMWQETSGIKKDTRARFTFPILSSVDVSELMVETCGRFRWEMCRKIQGVRWNDITEASLTSEYNDYIQYYRKNSNLSADAKEKIKNALGRAKNNYREVFVRDYQSWIKYEAKGSFRLNKVARDIIFRYCPFNKEIRKELGVNPMYREMFEKYDILKSRKVRHVEMWYDRYKKKGGEITEELQTNLDFYDL